jgi:alpha(1,3/1,4) fucosyltransferase
MKPTVKIGFADFWKHFNKSDNYFFHLLSKRFEVQLSDSPDFLLYSNYGEDHLKYDGIRIFYNGENERINWNACDYALSFEFQQTPKHYRLPNWVLYDDPELLATPKKDPEMILKEKTGFCNMVISNPHASKRIDFFNKLGLYKHVDSGGRYLNNIGGPVDNKRAFIRKYKFTIAFENSSYPGYTTEKLFEPMLENSVPLYWGNPVVGKDFNTKSFVNYNDYANEEAFIERIIELDKNDDLYLKVLSEPWYNDNSMPDYLKEDKILDFFEGIFLRAKDIRPVARRYNHYLYLAKRQVTKIDYALNSLLKYRKPFR